MTEVKFYEEIADERLAFAVILSKAQDKYVFCRHRDRETWEIPGGHREPGEHILDTAKRELYEETGALEFKIAPVCVYSVTTSDQVVEEELHSEIEQIALMDKLPDGLTYPDIQPRLMEEAGRRGYL